MFLHASSQTGSGMMKFIALCLILIGFVTVAMAQLYVNTADAVFYSAVSGNFGIAGTSDNGKADTDPQKELKEPFSGENGDEEK